MKNFISLVCYALIKRSNMQYNLMVKYTFSYLERAIIGKTADRQTAFLKAIPMSLLTTTVDIITGLTSRVFSIITLGTLPCINRIALENGYSSRLLFATPYMCLFRAIHLSSEEEDEFSFDRFFMENLILAEDKILEFNRSTCSLLEKHITIRLNYLLLGIAALVASVAEAIIATILTPVALFMAVYDPKYTVCMKINTLAFRSLMFPSIINDLGYYALKVLNPWSSELLQEEANQVNFLQNLKHGNIWSSNGSIFNLWKGQWE
jgi:hypothetical protein